MCQLEGIIIMVGVSAGVGVEHNYGEGGACDGWGNVECLML